MKITNLAKLKPKKLIVFDLDGTLAPTKSVIDAEMSSLMAKLLAAKKVAVIGGGKYALFQEQLLGKLKAPQELLQHLYLFPTTSTSFYRYQRGWKRIYRHELSVAERRKIKQAFAAALAAVNYRAPQKTYGQVIEDRGTQVTFSALGQDVVKVLGRRGVALKEQWLKENKPLKMRIAKLVAKAVPDLEVHAAGFTSIDVTKKGIDKAYGLWQIEKQLHVKVKDMLFVGDAIFPGGNDYAVVKTGVDYVQVRDPEQTKKVIAAVLEK